ncbi:MAG TPA: phage major capsid protein [Pirellulales bacterium]|nr:phage major capsid protein [Pirellulales bacterium]
MGPVRNYALDRGLAADASDDELDEWYRREHAAGRLAPPRWAELLAAEREQLLRDFAASGIETASHHASVAAQHLSADSQPAVLSPAADRLPSHVKGFAPMLSDTTVQPSMLFAAGARDEATGRVDVKAPSARYSSKRAQGIHAKTGQPVLRGGLPVEMPSEREHALIGAYFRQLALRNRIDVRPLSEHERDLLKELHNDHLWCGDVGGQHYTGAPLSEALGCKGTDFLDDATSGGASLVPYFFDTDIVTFPLLSGELFPLVDLRELGVSNQVKTGSLANPTASWSSNEGSGASIPLQTTDGIVAGISSSVFNIVMAITVGRDFLSDSPANVGAEISTLMGRRLTHELDHVIASGDGVTQPQGLSNASGVNSVVAKNGTTGPFVVSDVENMIASLPKQYRQKNDPSVCWVANDACWFKIRGISVSGTDQRRIFGYDYEQYTLADRPFRISNDLPGNDLFFGKLNLYRMWRRQGLQIEMSNEGRSLRLANEVLITARGRYAGRFTDGAGLSFMADAPLH